MVDVKPIAEAKKNYEDSSSLVPDRYRAGIKRAGDWQEKATSDNAERLYAEGVQKAVQKKSRQRALKKISTSEWQERSINKGGNAIGGAMRASGGKWASNVRPFFDALERLSLPDKTADAMANIDARLKPVVRTLQETKEAQ